MRTLHELQMKILVVDDNADNIQVIGNILREKGYAVGFALKGSQAIAMLQNSLGYDLILLDVDMPLMNGFETCKIIRQAGKRPDIPIIFLTAFTDVDKIVAGFEAGGNDYLTKPFNPKELLARVHTHLQLKLKSDQVTSMNELLERNNKSMTDSITYASNIQNALLTPLQILRENIPNHFILNKPCQIVSGDFYWFRKEGDSVYIIVGDCTGHGVPGAFMSILAISALSEIVKAGSVLSPADILDKLRKYISETLWYRNPESLLNDGIDLGICLISLENNTILYSGASRPFIIIRKNDFTSNYQLIEFRAGQSSLGTLSKDDKRFANQSINLQPGDHCYLFSDGFVSQFGGENNRKFSSKRLKELLLDIQGTPIEMQGQLMENAFNNWKGDFPQTDDVLMIGMKIF